jgi:hypothetical protein
MGRCAPNCWVSLPLDLRTWLSWLSEQIRSGWLLG